MKTKTTKTAAIKYARKQITCLYRFGGGWRYSSYDLSCRAWRECSPESYSQALSSRSRAMLRHAVMYMGFDRQTADVLAYDMQTNSGRWVYYVPETGDID